jgi:hypothetical protein
MDALCAGPGGAATLKVRGHDATSVPPARTSVWPTKAARIRTCTGDPEGTQLVSKSNSTGNPSRLTNWIGADSQPSALGGHRDGTPPSALASAALASCAYASAEASVSGAIVASAATSVRAEESERSAIG